MNAELKGIIFALLSSLILSCTSAPRHEEFVDQIVPAEGDMELVQGNYRRALQLYRESLEFSPRDPQLHRRIGITYIRLNNYRKSIKHLTAAKKIIPRDFEVGFYLAEALRATSAHRKAIKNYKLALQSKPEHAGALKGLSWSYFQINRMDDAFEQAYLAHHKNPKDGQAAIILARILLKQKHPTAALKLIRKAKRAADEAYLPYFLSVEGDALLGLEDYEMASKLFREALKLQPLLPGPLVGAAKCHLKAKNHDLARGFLLRAIRIKPNYANAYKLLAKTYRKSSPTKAAKYRAKYKSLTNRRVTTKKKYGREFGF